MIGIIKDEIYVTLQFWPVFGSEKGIPKWAEITFNYSPKNYGEYGIAWSKNGVWISWGLSTYTSFSAFFDAVKRKQLY